MPVAKKDLTKNQKQMIADGFPAKLLLSSDERKTLWANNPPKPLPAFTAPSVEESEETKRFRAALEEAEARKRVVKQISKRSQKPKRPSREGLISVAEVATRLKITPLNARAALRAAKYPKPAQGWAFDAATATQVEKIIKEQIECAPKSKKPSAKRSGKLTSTTTPKATPPTSTTPATKSVKRSSSKGRAASTSRNTKAASNTSRKATSGRQTKTSQKRTPPKKR